MYPSDPLDSQKPIILGRELLQKYSLSNLQKLSDEVSVSTNRIEKLIELLGINNLTKEDVEVIFERYKR
jgi:hypothetical protein